jgi:hypothetical protein
MTQTLIDNSWLLKDDADGADAEATTQFVQGVVKEHIVDNLDGELSLDDQEGQTKLKGMTDVETMSRLAAMRDKSDRAMTFHVSNVVTQGTYQYSPGEASDIGEWLAEGLDGLGEVKNSEYYDLNFISSQLVPFMMANDIPNAAVLWASGYKRKARSSVPLFRHYFKLAPPDLVDKVATVMSWITDPTKSRRDIEAEWQLIKGTQQVVMAHGKEVILAGGMTKLEIECDATQLGAIKKKLSGLVDFHEGVSI